ncbi:MAG: hypothetical protein ACLTS6_22050 [Anaerobutyricum sp.]
MNFLMISSLLNNEKISLELTKYSRRKGEKYRESDYVSALNVLGKVFVNAPAEKNGIMT